MIERQKFFLDFVNLTERLKCRGVTKRQLLTIRNKLIKEKEIKKNINNLRHTKNQLSQVGSENSPKVIVLKKQLRSEEKKLVTLSQKLHDLLVQVPNLPTFEGATNQEENRVIDNVEYSHNIQHNLTHEKILKKLALIDEEKSILLSGSKFVLYQ